MKSLLLLSFFGISHAFKPADRAALKAAVDECVDGSWTTSPSLGTKDGSECYACLDGTMKTSAETCAAGDTAQFITDWDTSLITDMSQMFRFKSEFNQPLNWDVSSVTNFLAMFTSAIKFNQDISSWDVSKVTNFEAMFYNNFPGLTMTFNQDISSWDMSSAEHLKSMCKESIFNQTKIYQQLDGNEDLKNSISVTKGGFQWENGDKNSKVIFVPNNSGRFLVSWVPPIHIQNRVVLKNGIYYPGNEHMGAFGCDPYDISGTVDRRGSNGSLHGLTKFSMEDAPPNHFFLEYISRPQTAEIFFEDVLMACIFYGMPILAENNKPRLLYYFKRRGYRGFAMNRPDKKYNKLSVTEKEIGGIPNSSEDIKQAHASAIETYIEDFVGLKETGYGDVYFQRTLEDWARFNINNRTTHDASISSGLALMACNKHRYAPSIKREFKKIELGIKRYNNKGYTSKIIS